MGKGSLTTIAALTVMVGACASEPRPLPAPTAATPAPQVVAYAEQNQPVGSRMPMDGDLCRASENQNLVGRSRTDIPVPVDVINRRVACTTCAITEDYSPYRLNIFYNQATGVVEEVRCG
jgi:hypothetical protein